MKEPDRNRQTDAAAQAAEEDLQRLAELGRDHAYVAHEMRRPLVSIGLIARSLKRRADLSREEAEMLDNIIRLAMDGEMLLRDCLDYVTPGSGQWRRVDVCEVLEKVVADHAEQARANKVKMVIERPEAKNLPVLCVPDKLARIVSNLIENAIDAVTQPADRPVSPARVQVRCSREKDTVRIEICDNGPGIDHETLKHVFRPFFTTRVEGNGLGLPLVRKLTEEMGGEVYVDTQPLQGTTVRLDVPAAADVDSSHARATT